MVVLHIPHASTPIPATLRSQFTISNDELDDEVLHMTDHATDLLFSGTDAVSLVFGVSRLVVDPERFPTDEREPMAARGMGAVYTHGYRGTRIRRTPAAGDRERLMDEWYYPHHRRLGALVQTALERDGVCTIVDAHSFASRPLPYEPDQSADRPEICLGTDAFHTPQWLVELAADHLCAEGYAVELNRPYAGALVPTDYFGHDDRVRSIMVEVRRDRYLDEDSGRPGSEFERVRAHVSGLIRRIQESERSG
jgi:N-formylglutamate deformylase